jgi:hypothetical protein
MLVPFTYASPAQCNIGLGRHYDAAAGGNIPVGAEGPEGGGEDLIRNRVAADLARKFVRRAKIGGAEGIRTPDLRSAIAALSQLSYGPAAGTNRPNKLPAF